MENHFSSDYLIQCDRYQQVLETEVLPWLKEREKETTLNSYDGHPLYCVSYNADDPAGTVLIVHGFTENAYKYSELIYSLLHSGFSVVAYDQRGHGRSWRPETIPDASVTHVDHFEDYVKDLRTVCEDLLARMPKPWMLFAHSMGGAVASLYLEQFSDTFSAAVLSSPMIAPQTAGFPSSIAKAMASAAVMFRKGRKNPFFMKVYSGPENFETSCATDPRRFAWYDEVKATHREFQNSVPSYRWSLESLRVTDKILAHGKPESIRCPVLLFSAENDYSVRNDMQEVFVRRLAHGQLVRVPDARHEIYRSVNAVLFPWWRQVLGFLSASRN